MRISLLFALLLLPSVLIGQSPEIQPGTVTIRFSHHVEPVTAMVEAMISAKGACLSAVETRKGVYDYPVVPPVWCLTKAQGEPKSIRLLIYIPGYRMVTAEFHEEELRKGVVFEPELLSIPTVRLNGRLVDSAKQPLPDETLNVAYSLIEAMGYFGYVDGSVPVISIASATTNADGEFHADLPALLEDPFFQRHDSSAFSGQFQLISRDPTGLRDITLKPNAIPLQANYRSLLVTKTEKGTLSGSLGKAFLKENHLAENLRSYVKRGDTIVSGIDLFVQSATAGNFYARLQGDGSFEVQLPAGKYDLILRMEDRQILVQSGITIEENKRLEIQKP